MAVTARVALSKDFLACLARLPKQIEKKVRTFTEKFEADPTQPGINFERLQGAVDPKVRSVRIDKAYRAIVIHPPKGDVFLCVWVDHHDRAYAWVKNKRFEVNPKSGVLQLFDVQEMPFEPPAPNRRTEAAQEAVGLFAQHDDEDLLLAGVPGVLLPSIRALQTDGDLDAISTHLPEDCAEALYGLAAGMSVTEAIAEAAKTSQQEIDTNDFAAALERPTTRRQFKVVEDGSELASMFDQPLEQWRLFLHPSQQKIVEADVAGPMRVLGGAGTGKTVVLMHRARRLANTLPGEGKILVTTYTRNLARDLRRNLKILCGDAGKRLEVTNLDAWARNFVASHGATFRILAQSAERKKRMRLAADENADVRLPQGFFLEEWDRVIQANDILDEHSYLRVSRKGRGIRLDRARRSEAWRVFSAYRSDLERDNLMEWADVIREARLILERSNAPPPFAAVCADEAQDFGGSALRLLRALAPRGRNDLFLAGDGHQRIYGQPITLSSCGIEVRGRAHKLRLNYRTTDMIARQGLAIVRGLSVDDLDGGEDSLAGYTSLRRGLKPESHLLKDEAEEADVVLSKVRQWLEVGRSPEDICLVTRTGQPLEARYRPLLEEAGIATTQLDSESEEGDAPGCVRLATMHRLKGLEYPCILLASVHDGEVPLRFAVETDDPATRKEAIAQEQCLLYVACTRARDELVICGYGKPSRLMK